MNKFYLIIVTLLILLTGCSRHIDSSDPIRSLHEFDDPVSDVRLFVDNGVIHLSWSYSGKPSPTGYQVVVYDNTYATDPNVEPVKEYATTLPEINISDLTPNVQYFFSIIPEFDDDVLGVPSDPIPGLVTYFDMNINNNQNYTASRTSNIRINTPISATHMMISEDPLFTSMNYIRFAATSSFTLSDNDGPKVVYASLLFADGSELLNPIWSSIVLDRKAEIVNFTITAPDSISTGDTIFFIIYGGPNEAGASASVHFGSVRLDLSDNGNWPDISAGDNNYNGLYVVPVNFSLNAVTVTGNYTDEAGNNAELIADDLLTIFLPPQESVDLSVSLTVDGSAVLSWTLSTEDDFDHYELQRSTSSDMSSPTSVAIINNQNLGSQTSYLPDTNVYYFQLLEFDHHNMSTGSNIVSVNR